MIGYVLMDIQPFAILGILMIVTFGIAFRVLFANAVDEDDGQCFNSPWRSFESMFYATLGQFEPEVFEKLFSCLTMTMCTVDILHAIHELLDHLAVVSLLSVPVLRNYRSLESSDCGSWRHM